MEYVLLVIALVAGTVTVGALIMAVRIKPDWPKDKAKAKLWTPPTPTPPRKDV